MTSLLALLLCHDHFFAKSGVAANAKHPLRAAIERQKHRLQSEFTRARLKRRCASVEALTALLDRESSSKEYQHPRWVRINTLIETRAPDLIDGLPPARIAGSLKEVLESNNDEVVYRPDQNIPNLHAYPPNSNLTKSQAYIHGRIILQDKASCFPAWLLLGGLQNDPIGDVVDGCAAPGNKTSHLAAILKELGQTSRIFACEKDVTRSQTLKTMTLKAGAGQVEVLAKQDFLALDPFDLRFTNVTHLLLDPSCSGSGIVNRQDIPKLALPVVSATVQHTNGIRSAGQSKKRRRDDLVDSKDIVHPVPDGEEAATTATIERLRKLSNLQTRIVEHAMRFPAATRITYSTCSIHEQENEVVVSRLLNSETTQKHGWSILPREEQVEGLKKWRHRGVKAAGLNENTLDKDQLDACIRCHPEDEEATMGFFVCAFRRNTPTEQPQKPGGRLGLQDTSEEGDPVPDDEWTGFD